jgi:hypothetical protein
MQQGHGFVFFGSETRNAPPPPAQNTSAAETTSGFAFSAPAGYTFGQEAPADSQVYTADVTALEMDLLKDMGHVSNDQLVREQMDPEVLEIFDKRTSAAKSKTAVQAGFGHDHTERVWCEFTPLSRGEGHWVRIHAKSSLRFTRLEMLLLKKQGAMTPNPCTLTSNVDWMLDINKLQGSLAKTQMDDRYQFELNKVIDDDIDKLADRWSRVPVPGDESYKTLLAKCLLNHMPLAKARNLEKEDRVTRNEELCMRWYVADT